MSIAIKHAATAAEALAAARIATAQAREARARAEQAHQHAEADELVALRDQRDIAARRLEKAEQAEAEALAAVQADDRVAKAAKLRELRKVLDVPTTIKAMRALAEERLRLEREHALKLATLDGSIERARVIHNERLGLALELARELGEDLPSAPELSEHAGSAIVWVVKNARALEVDPRAFNTVVRGFGYQPHAHPMTDLEAEDFPGAEQVAACLDGTFARRDAAVRETRELKAGNNAKLRFHATAVAGVAQAVLNARSQRRVSCPNDEEVVANRCAWGLAHDGNLAAPQVHGIVAEALASVRAKHGAMSGGPTGPEMDDAA